MHLYHWRTSLVATHPHPDPTHSDEGRVGDAHVTERRHNREMYLIKDIHFEREYISGGSQAKRPTDRHEQIIFLVSSWDDVRVSSLSKFLGIKMGRMAWVNNNKTPWFA